LGETDRGSAAIAEAEGGGRGLGQVDDALAVEGTTVVDHDLDRLAAILIGDLHFRAEGKGTMRRRHGVFVEDLS